MNSKNLIYMGMNPYIMMVECFLTCKYMKQQKVKNVKRCTTTTELVVVQSLCSIYTSVAKSMPVITLFAIAIAKSTVRIAGNFCWSKISQLPPRPSEGFFVVLNFVLALWRDHTYCQLACTS